jgi:hypothetical protein
MLSQALPALATTQARTATFESNLSNDASTDNGEPSIAVNPANPNNIVVSYLQNNDAGVHSLYYQELPTVSHTEATIQGCSYAVTWNGGRTWERRPLTRSDPLMNNCSDTTALFGPDGTAYIEAATYNTAWPAADDVVVMSSHDGGATWGEPVTALRNLVSPGQSVAPPGPYVPFFLDRPWLALDPSTDTLYVDAVQYWIDAGGFVHNVIEAAASTDHGLTWGAPTLVDGPVPAGTVETQGPPPSASHGTVAIAYVDPSSSCSCVVLATSSNDARSFVHHKTPFQSPSGAFGGTQVAADPAHAGWFAVAVLDSTGTRLRIYRTTDTGRTWSAPTVLTTAGTSGLNEPWIAYSPQGALGAGWKSLNKDGTYAFWAAYSADGGALFTPSVRVSSAPSPAPNPYYVAGDDYTSVAVTAHAIYGAWGDWRGGRGENAWWGGFSVGA